MKTMNWGCIWATVSMQVRVNAWTISWGVQPNTKTKGLGVFSCQVSRSSWKADGLWTSQHWTYRKEVGTGGWHIKCTDLKLILGENFARAARFCMLCYRSVEQVMECTVKKIQENRRVVREQQLILLVNLHRSVEMMKLWLQLPT